MPISTMRLLDQWLGVPVCVVLTMTRALFDYFGRSTDDPCNRIVFLKLAEQGTTVLACSAVQRAIDMVGQDNVYFLVFEDNRCIVDAIGQIRPENVITIRTDRAGTLVGDALRAIRRMRELQIDTAIDLEFFARSSSALSFLGGAHRRVGFHAFNSEGPYRGDLMTHRLRFNPHLHTSNMFRMMVEALGVSANELPRLDMVPIEVHGVPPRFQPSPRMADEVRSILRNSARTERFKPLILLNPTCSDLLPLRRWPVERFVELARRLIDRYPEVRVGMIGAPSEATSVTTLVKQVGLRGCFNLAGRTTLEQLLAIYEEASVLVTTDSGPAHFAALTGIDVVTLFGPEHPKLFAACTPRNHIFWERIACSPCVSAFNNRTSPCRDNVCMQRIDVDRVFEKVCHLYDARKSANLTGQSIASRGNTLRT